MTASPLAPRVPAGLCRQGIGRALLIPPLVARIHAEEKLLHKQLAASTKPTADARGGSSWCILD
jgi:hypothetical protein